MKIPGTALVLFAACATCVFGQGTILWDESVNGPLSEDYTHPTPFGVLSQGTNSVIGSVRTEVTGNNYAAHDDYFTFAVSGGDSLAGVYLQVDKPTLVWIGNPSFSSMLGQVINPSNGELLAQMGLGSLGPGTFGMYLSNNEFGSSTSISNYRVDFLVQAVPEPGAVSLFLVGAGAVGFLRWKKGRLNNALSSRTFNSPSSLGEGNRLGSLFGVLFLTVSLSIGARGQGTVLWDESVNGPFSEDFHSPTALTSMSPGTNSILGMTEAVPNGNNWTTHPDYFTITVPSAMVVSDIYLAIDKPNVWAWIGDTSYINQIGFVSNASSDNLLAQWGTARIGPGVYGVYFSNNDLQSVTSIASYRLDFLVEPIPEPGAVSLFLVGAGVVGFLRWKTSRLPQEGIRREVKGIRLKRPGTALIFSALFATCAFGQGTTLWDESVNGPFSGSSGSPTRLAPFQPGTNTVIGKTEIEPNGGLWTVQPDFFTVQVPNGLVVTAVFLEVDKPNVWHWIGDTAFLNELGFVQNPAPGNLLFQWVLSSIGTGAYGMDIENHDAQSFPSIASYRLDFFTQSVPEPSTICLLVAGAGLIGFHHWTLGKGRT